MDSLISFSEKRGNVLILLFLNVMQNREQYREKVSLSSKIRMVDGRPEWQKNKNSADIITRIFH